MTDMSEQHGPAPTPASAPMPGADPAAMPVRKRRMSPRTRIILIVLALGAVVAVAAWYLRYRSYGQYMQSTDDAQIAADLVTIAPKVNGYVEAVLVDENQDVAAGQALVRIDPRDYRSEVDQARAQIAQAEAGVDNARASIAVQRAQVAEAQAQLSAARTQAAHDAAEVARYRPLVASGAETRQQLSELESQARQSADRVRQIAAQVEAQASQIGGLEAQIAQARAQGQAGRAQLRSADTNLGATTLTTPVAGRIGDRTVTLGQFVQPGMRLMSVVPLADLYITANFKETQLALMRPGQPVTIEIDALSGLELAGHVASVSPGTGAQFSLLPPENATGNFTKIVQRVPVRIAVDAGPDVRELLVPGLSVEVTVDTRGAKGDLDRIRAAQGQRR